MSLQSQLNNDAISQLPAVKSAISAAVEPVRSSMVSYSVRAVMNSATALDDITNEQKNLLDKEIMQVFKHNNWI